MKNKILVITLIILFIIISTSLIVFHNKTKSNNKNANYTDKIEPYINEIYGSEITIPEFNDINEANDDWLWDNLVPYITKIKQLTSIEYTKEDLTNFAKELYGTHFSKELPQKGSNSILYNEENNKYVLGGYGLDTISAFALISTRNIKDNLYEAIIAEYKIDTLGILKNYEQYGEGGAYDVYNLSNEKITQFDSNYNDILEKINKYVKENSGKFSQKKLILEYSKENDCFYIISSKNQI